MRYALGLPRSRGNKLIQECAASAPKSKDPLSIDLRSEKKRGVGSYLWRNNSRETLGWELEMAE
jgi:hypothetical protein